MSPWGDLFSLFIALIQEIGIVLGVGALTITLIGHLLSLHARVDESLLAYVRAARNVRATALSIIVLSGVLAVLVHLSSGTLTTVVAPVFIFKWLLIGLAAALYFLELETQGYTRDFIEGFEGANWYALFIVHAMAPAIGWVFLGEIYGAWLMVFGLVWAGFVWFMRHQSTLPAKPTPAPTPVTPPVVAPKPTAPPAPKPVPVAAPAPAPKPVATTPAPAMPTPQPVPVVAKVEVHPNHTLIPMIPDLDLPAPSNAPAVQPDLPRVTVMPKGPAN